MPFLYPDANSPHNQRISNFFGQMQLNQSAAAPPSATSFPRSASMPHSKLSPPAAKSFAATALRHGMHADGHPVTEIDEPPNLSSSSASTISSTATVTARKKDRNRDKDRERERDREKANRGNYLCGRCQQPKANHVCTMADAPLTASKEVQVSVIHPL